MKIDRAKLADALQDPTVQRSIKLRQQVCLQGGLCGEASAIGLVCTEPLAHLDADHVAKGEDGNVIQRWPR